MTGASTRLRSATAFLSISAGLISYTCLEFMLEAVQHDFAMTGDETMVVADIASGACLLVVFLVGALADRLGDRWVLSAASGAFCIGAVIVGLAPSAAFLLVGQSLAGIGTITMSIVGLSILNKSYPERAQRARAFGVFAVIAPVVAIVLPLVSSLVVSHAGWRWVTGVWIAVGVATLTLARRALPARDRIVDHSARVELTTPLLAGVALAGITMTISFTKINSRTEAHAISIIVSACIGVTAFVALIVLLRIRSQSTFDLRALRVPGSRSIVAALFVVNGVNLFFFTFAMLQFRYHQTLLETGAMLIVPQITAACGALIGARLSARHGSTRIATSALVASAALSLSALMVAADSSPWAPVLVLSLAALPIGAVAGPLTQTFMDLAPAEGAGAASSLRSSAVNLGIAIGGLIVGTIVFDELDADTTRSLAAYRKQAEAFHLAGLFCFAAYLVATVLVIAHTRRVRNTPHRLAT